MSGYLRCAKCASDQMMDGAYFADAGGARIVVGLDRHPELGPLSRAVSTQVRTSVCGSCGYVELYAHQPAELYEVYRQAEAPS